MGIKLASFLTLLFQAYSAASEELQGAVQHDTSASPDAPKSSSSSGVAPIEFTYQNYKLETFLILFLVVYGLVFIYGRAANNQIIDKLEGAVTDVLKEQFSTVAQPKGSTFERDSVSDIVFWATGRRNCESLHGYIHLSPRHDIVGIIRGILSSSGDVMTVEATLGEKAPGFVFALVPKNKHRAVLRNRFDIGTFAKPIKVDDLNDKYVAMSEHSDFLQNLKGSLIFSNISTSGCLLSELYISDQPETKPTDIPFSQNKRLVAKIKLPKLDDSGLALLKNTLEYVMYLVDYTSKGISIRPELISKQDKLRQEAHKELYRKAEQQKKEELNKTVLEKKKIKMESLERLPPDQRRKAEEKLRAKEEKKSKKRMTVRA